MKISSNPQLGAKVKQHLINKNLEFNRANIISDNEKIDIISKAYKDILTALSLTTSEFTKTPYRVARMFTQEIFYGLDYNNFPDCTLFKNDFMYKGALTQKNINIMSFCEHHFVPFEGIAEISFIPKDENIIGLSKLNQICNFFSRRPQIQERLTAQIFETLKFLLNTDDIEINIQAKHTCVSFRGENDKNSITETKIAGGIFL